MHTEEVVSRPGDARRHRTVFEHCTSGEQAYVVWSVLYNSHAGGNVTRIVDYGACLWSPDA